MAQKVQDSKSFTKALLKIVRVKTGNLMGEKTEALIVEDSEEVLWMMGNNVLEHAYCGHTTVMGKKKRPWPSG